MDKKIILLFCFILLSPSIGRAEKEPDVRGVAVMLSSGNIQLGYTKDWLLEKDGYVHFQSRQQYIQIIGMFGVKYPREYVCRYLDYISTSNISSVSFYPMPFDGQSYYTAWQVRSPHAVVMLQRKPFAEYMFNKGIGSGCDYWLMSYNKKITEKELEQLSKGLIIDDEKVLELERDNIYMIWRCSY